MNRRRQRLLAAVWRHTHRDFKGHGDDGSREILAFVPGQGTCIVTLDALSDDELLERLPASARALLDDDIQPA